jgi:hypothetical protein
VREAKAPPGAAGAARANTEPAAAIAVAPLPVWFAGKPAGADAEIAFARQRPRKQPSA